MQVLPEINVCDFSTLDLDKDYDVDEEELITLIQMSGLEELEDLFEKLDKDGGKYLLLFFFGGGGGGYVCFLFFVFVYLWNFLLKIIHKNLFKLVFW